MMLDHKQLPFGEGLRDNIRWSS